MAAEVNHTDDLFIMAAVSGQDFIVRQHFVLSVDVLEVGISGEGEDLSWFDSSFESPRA